MSTAVCPTLQRDARCSSGGPRAGCGAPGAAYHVGSFGARIDGKPLSPGDGSSCQVCPLLSLLTERPPGRTSPGSGRPRVGGARRLLRGVIKVEAAQPFAQPVTAREASDYASIIRRPMDLATVLEGIQSHRYASLGAPLLHAAVDAAPRYSSCVSRLLRRRADEVLADVNLIWANCRAYNPAGSPILEACSLAQQTFQERWLLAGLPSEHLFDEPPLDAVLLPKRRPSEAAGAGGRRRR